MPLSSPQVLTNSLSRLSLTTPTLPPATETNSYIVSCEGEFWLVEPASPYREEQSVLIDVIETKIASGEKFLGMILTHHHPDHVGAANTLRNHFSVPVVAHEKTSKKLEKIQVDQWLSDTDTLLHGTVEVLLTPGHAPGHLCLWHRHDGWIIVGDMVASVGTIVIDPDDDGDMGEYLAQLERLQSLGTEQLLPAHGGPIDDPQAKLGFYIAHRKQREQKIFDAVTKTEGAATLENIVKIAYHDTPTALWPIAERSAQAHLNKLVSDNVLRIETVGGSVMWRRS